jgi:hypothetical protein
VTATTAGTAVLRAVAAFRDGFDEAGSAGGIAEGAPDLGDRGVQAGIEFDEGFVCPDELSQFLARDQVARPAHQEAENPGRLLLEGHAAAVTMQDPCIEIELERPETHETTVIDHGHRPSRRQGGS